VKTDPIPVWKFFEIPHNGIEICQQLAINQADNSKEKQFWHRAAALLAEVKSQTADQLIERDFDWMLKLRVMFEKDEEVAKVISLLNNG
jgi:hypothetical protein